jgi:hypothetical protein
MDYGTLGRIERGELPNVSVAQLCLACGAVGLEFSGRAFPDGDPTRDAGHLRLLSRFRKLLPAAAPWRTEVPIPFPGDRRALDAWTKLEGQTIGIEAETRLDDIQALARRIGLKKRDASLDRLVLLVADTRGNRDVLNVHRETLRSAFPLDTRQILAAMRDGKAPRDDGIAIA